ncbi:MAG TPA: phospholipase A2 [Baekduia sp.]|uniref:phospholipase A2 n=1 Tax=Baekduia sp. TaxID=2600305 RepID=UPI002D78BFD0|nr:phospholipase A2 [Baekduia sp.]HET6506025.1 phospholipase A2 [Baekduia sp.]
MGTASTLRRRGRTTVALSALAGLLLVAPAAQAKKVTSLVPWKASNHYLVEADLDGRALPKLKPVAQVNHLRQGQWVKITCQTTGQNAYGSKLWDKVGGLYVPDHFIKTYTDGGIPGVPSCGAAAPAPAPAPAPDPKPTGPTRAQLAAAVKAVEYERVYGHNWARYQAKYPNNGIIWDHNGCSVPKALLELHGGWTPLAKSLSYYSRLFEKSCNRHDFGYRNYGSATNGLKLDPTEARRHSIDVQLHHNMDYQCDKTFSRKYVEAVQRGACHKASDAFYWAVSHFAQSHFLA